MLIGFLKNLRDKGCDCKIIKYVDRIWLLNERGDAQFRRQFVAEINPQSKCGLNEIKMVVPAKKIEYLKLLNKDCFDKNFIFNNRQFLSTGNYEVLEKPSHEYDLGYIENDGLGKIKVFNYLETNTVTSDLNKPIIYNIITFDFPHLAPMIPGDRTEINISFIITSLFNVVNPKSPFPSYNVPFDYFEDSVKKELLSSFDEVPVALDPYPDNPDHPGGFAVFIYPPMNFEKVNGFMNCDERIEEIWDCDGKSLGNNMRYRLRLRDLPIDHNKKVVGMGDFFSICGSLVEKWNEEKTLESIKCSVDGVVAEKLKTIKSNYDKGSKKSHKLSIIAIALSIILPIILFILGLFLSHQIKF